MSNKTKTLDALSKLIDLIRGKHVKLTNKINAIIDPDNEVLEGQTVIEHDPGFVSGKTLSLTTGETIDGAPEYIVALNYTPIKAGTTYTLVTDSSATFRFILYDVNKQIVKGWNDGTDGAWRDNNGSFEVPSSCGAASVRCFAETTVIPSTFKLINQATNQDIFKTIIGGTGSGTRFQKAAFTNQYAMKTYAIDNDPNMHGLNIERDKDCDEEFSIVEIAAPSKKPYESTLTLMNSGDKTVQFLDLSSMRYDESAQGTIELVCQSRGANTPLPRFMVNFNDGKGAGRVQKLVIRPDALPIQMINNGLLVRKNNDFTNVSTDDDWFEFSFKDIVDDVTALKNSDNSITFEQCGAIGDGITDDTVALQKAIDKAGETGKIILIGKGTYLFTERLIINKSVNIIGSGADDSVLLFKEKEYHTETKYDTEWWEGSNAAIVCKASSCTFMNFTLKGGDGSESASSYNGFIFHYPYKYPATWAYEACQRINMLQCVVQGFKNGLYMFGGWNRYINGCYFKECSDSGIKYEPLEVDRLGNYTSSGDIIEACQITGCKKYGIDIEYVYENYFVNCVMEYNGRAIRAVNCRDLTFKTCWNEANYDNIQVVGNARFEGGFNISNATVEHETNAENDVVVFTENGDTIICRKQKVVYKQVGGVVVKGVLIGSELENNILNPYWEEEIGGDRRKVSTQHWEAYTPNYCTIDTEELYNGHYSAHISASGLTDDADYGWRTEKILINDGTDYTLSFMAKVSDFQTVNNDKGMKVFVQWINASGVATLNEDQFVTFSSNEWEEKTIKLKPNSNSAYVKIGFGFQRNGDGYVSIPALVDNNSTISSDVRVTQGTGSSGKIINFYSSDGNQIGAIDLDKYKDGDTLNQAFNEMLVQMKLINNELYGTDIQVNSENGEIEMLVEAPRVTLGNLTRNDTMIVRSRNLFDYTKYVDNTEVYSGYRGLNLADLVYIKPSTKYTCSTSATDGSTLYFGQGLDCGVDESGGVLTAESDENGNLYIWILSGRDHYDDMISGKIQIQVEEGEIATNFVPHSYKEILISSASISTEPLGKINTVFQSKQGNEFILTYSGDSLEVKLTEKLQSLVGDGTITIRQNGVTKGSFTVNQNGDAEIDLVGTNILTDDTKLPLTGGQITGDLYVGGSFNVGTQSKGASLYYDKDEVSFDYYSSGGSSSKDKSDTGSDSKVLGFRGSYFTTGDVKINDDVIIKVVGGMTDEGEPINSETISLKDLSDRIKKIEATLADLSYQDSTVVASAINTALNS